MIGERVQKGKYNPKTVRLEEITKTQGAGGVRLVAHNKRRIGGYLPGDENRVRENWGRSPLDDHIPNKDCDAGQKAKARCEFGSRIYQRKGPQYRRYEGKGLDRKAVKVGGGAIAEGD